MNKRIKKKQIKMNNKKLCKRYPFLIPHNRFTDKICWSKGKRTKRNRYIRPYNYTELDAMPEGWRKTFGRQICEEIREVLVKGNYLNKYRITQIKEKWGQLRWYDYGVPSCIYDEFHNIINKYSVLSKHTCIYCGKPAEMSETHGWIEPVCEECEKFFRR